MSSRNFATNVPAYRIRRMKYKQLFTHLCSKLIGKCSTIQWPPPLHAFRDHNGSEMRSFVRRWRNAKTVGLTHRWHSLLHDLCLLGIADCGVKVGLAAWLASRLFSRDTAWFRTTSKGGNGGKLSNSAVKALTSSQKTLWGGVASLHAFVCCFRIASKLWYLPKRFGEKSWQHADCIPWIGENWLYLHCHYTSAAHKDQNLNNWRQGFLCQRCQNQR